MAERDAKDIAAEAYCRSAEDYYAEPARRAMVRLCAEPLGERYLTPLEFLHSEFHQRIIYESGELLGPFQTAALAQAKQANLTPQQRQKELVALFDEVVSTTKTRNRAVQGLALKATSLPELLDELAGVPDGDLRAFAVYLFLGKKLENCTAWLTKLHKLVGLYAPDFGDDAISYLDQILAEILLSRAAINELLGKATSLEKAVPGLIKLHDGKIGAGEDAGGPIGDVVTRSGTMKRISRLLASGRFAASQSAIRDAIARILAIPRPYRENERGSELHALIGAHRQFLAASDAVRESPAWTAFTKRVGGAVSDANLESFVRTQKAPGARLRHLLFFRQFCETDHQKGLLEVQIEKVFRDPGLYDDLMREGRTLVDKLRLFGFIYRRIHETPMDAFRKLSTIAEISAMQARFIEEQNFFDSLSWVYHDVVDRALALLDLLRDGMFVEGPAQKIARRTSRRLVASEEFQTGYLKDAADEVDAARRMELLKKRLIEAGLMQ